MLTIGKDPAVDDRSAAVAPRERRQLVGNRWALAGAIIYLLEWVAIAGWLGALVGINGGGVTTTSSSTASDIFRQYSHAGTAAAIALGAGWFALVLPGRILLIAGIRQGLRRSWGESPLADLAVGAMTVSVAVEIATYAVAAGVGHAATSGGDQPSVVTGDAVSNLLNASVFSPIGLSVLAISVVMLQSRLFPWWLSLLGVLAGAALCIEGVLGGAGSQIGAHLYPGFLDPFGVFGFWAWMLVTGVLLFRATGKPRQRRPRPNPTTHKEA